MKIFNNQNIEQFIIIFLSKEPLMTIVLFKKIQGKLSCTKQGFYKSLRNLKKQEIVVIRSKKVSLSYLWVKKQSDFYNSILYKYINNNIPVEDFLFLKDKDSITYKFTNISMADTFWIHALSILNQKIPINESMCIYNPHEWFLLVRNESEESLFEDMKQIKRKFVVLADNKNPLDVFVRKYFNFKTDYYYISEKKIFRKNNYYLNVIGDYCIEVWIDKRITNLIEDFYKKTLVFDNQAEEVFKKILEIKGKNKFVISKNKEKSDKFKKIFQKFFVI